MSSRVRPERLLWEDEQDPVEFRPLTLVDRHGIGGFVLWQSGRSESAQGVLFPMNQAQSCSGFSVAS